MAEPKPLTPDRKQGIEARLVPDPSPGPRHLTVWARLDLGDRRKEWVAVGRLTGDKR